MFRAKCTDQARDVERVAAGEQTSNFGGAWLGNVAVLGTRVLNVKPTAGRVRALPMGLAMAVATAFTAEDEQWYIQPYHALRRAKFFASLYSTPRSKSAFSPPPSAKAERPVEAAKALRSAKMKYVLVSGGVISGIGKGVIASSCGLLLKTQGWKVSSIKIDPYLNIDAGTMAPREHGEVFVLNDGGEVDLDLGNYERYLSVTLTRENNITTGKMYQTVIERERAGKYLGRTVQMVPHLTDAIIEQIERVSAVPVDDTNEKPDVCIIELGGTIGDMESNVFIEALRQLRRRIGKDNFLQIHVSLIVDIHGEMKTKPTQAAIREVRSLGLSPDLIACRCSKALDETTINKIALYCDVERTQVVSVTDVASLYHVPLLLESQGLIRLISEILRLDLVIPSPWLVKRGGQTWNAWKELTISQDHLHNTVTIALVGKYTDHPDSYHSVVKSLEHAAMACLRKLVLISVDAEHLEESAASTSPKEFHKAWHEVHQADGILIPGGFGERGCEGMIAAIKTCREKKIPFLGICLGLQLATVEFARNRCNLPQAVSAEFNAKAAVPTELDVDAAIPVQVVGESAVHVIVHMDEIDRSTMGANMRLGNHPTVFQPGSEWSKIYQLYHKDTGSSTSTTNGNTIGTFSNGDYKSPSVVDLSTKDTKSDTPNGDANTPSLGNKRTPNGTTLQTPSSTSDPNPLIVHERHRHRYEVNPKYVAQLERAGLHFVGRDEGGKRMEILELKDHPYFVGVQFHPEYLSRVLRPSKPFLGLVAASVGILPQVMSGKKRSESSVALVDGMEGVRI